MKICVPRGLGGYPQQARGAIWIATSIACQFYRKFLITSFFPLSINTNPTADLYQILLTPNLYSSLILSEKLYPHLSEIDRAARERMDAILPRMMEAAGVTEELKARDPMRWVGLMNTLKAQAEEVIFQELIYI